MLPKLTGRSLEMPLMIVLMDDEAAACERRARDAFGRQQTEINREASRHAAERLGRLRQERCV